MLDPLTQRLLTNLHGLLAVVWLASLIHLGFFLRRFRGRAVKAVIWLAHSALVSGVAVIVMGWVLYPDYREEIKPDLALSPLRWVANGFDVKEHLGYYAAVLTVVLWGWIVLQRKMDADTQREISPAPLAWAGALLVALVGALGVMVSSHQSF
jgi:hypothetical protein